MKRITLLLLSLFWALANGQTTYFTFDLARFTSLDIRTLSDGQEYPSGGQILDAGGVPMYIANASENPSALLVVYVGDDDRERSFDIPIDLRGATRVYTLINNLWGECEANIGKVEVFGRNGSYASLDLIVGFNVRDHFQGAFCNTLSDPTVFSLEFGEARSVRLDRQVLELPSEFQNDIVEYIRFSGRGRYPDGAAFLAALTVEADGCQTANADLNSDGCVNDADLLAVLFAFGSNDRSADVNCDAVVDGLDLEIVLNEFGQGC